MLVKRSWKRLLALTLVTLLICAFLPLAMILPLPRHISILPDLLLARSRQSTAGLAFLDTSGELRKKLSYSELLYRATLCAHRLAACGFKRGGRIIISSFDDIEKHVILFWACCLAGILLCPLPPLHSDPTRQTQLLKHLQQLFDRPVLVTTKETEKHVQSLVNDFQTLAFDALPALDDCDNDSSIYPSFRACPEDPVCLMLTSGSTGQPKAVVLRHAQIISSCRGKLAHHLTSHQSRFLNWIAFDHVACLTEIHIHALLANAEQYHIAPNAIVRNPRLLLTLASRFGVSYTFSPNFLLAQIIRDTAAAPIQEDLNLTRLRALISGGEAVPLKTAVGIADLLERYGAPRSALRAGFGMSETGAGSVYSTDAIPRSAEGGGYLPLGRPCRGLAMRIVGQHGQARDAGEPGQLQVFGPSVFRKYFRNSEATTSAFTADGWFDTGDLGLIDRAGNLHLVGRDKDCLNINGVKLSTVDVENYVLNANIKSVGPDGIFVCPMRLQDADTETYGVFYAHDNDDSSGLALRHSVLAMNTAIKKACSMVVSQSPHIVLPLPSSQFVKTSLGKVSRAQLARAYLAGDFSAIEQELKDATATLADTSTPDLISPLEQTVAEAISDLFNVERSAIRRSTNVFDMGASSMHLMRLKTVLQERLNLGELPTMDLLTRPEVGLLCDFLQALSNRASAPSSPMTDGNTAYEPLVCFTATGSKPPLFLVHPGVGEVLVFINLARELAANRPVYALRARGFDDASTPFTSLSEMIDSYLAALERAHPTGPFYLAGYSYGGAVAFLLGKALEARGRTVAWLGVLNLPPHIQFRMRELSWSEVLLNLGMFLALVPAPTLPDLRTKLAAAFPAVAARDTPPADPAAPVRWLLAQADTGRRVELALSEAALVRWAVLAHAVNLTGREFVPAGSVRGALLTVFCAVPLPSMGTREEFKSERLAQWEEFAGRAFEMVDVDGEHYTMLSEAHVQSFAAHMRGALERAEALAATPIGQSDA